jgi:tryptophanyl-tRNA synthetase
MSKTNPETAIFLTDDEKTVNEKIKRAETAFEGKMSEALQNHIFLAKELGATEEELKMIDDIIARHLANEKVMGDFKNLFAKIVNRFISDFKTRKDNIMADASLIDKILEKGARLARKNASETMGLVREVMYK